MHGPVSPMKKRRFVLPVVGEEEVAGSVSDQTKKEILKGVEEDQMPMLVMSGRDARQRLYLHR